MLYFNFVKHWGNFVILTNNQPFVTETCFLSNKTCNNPVVGKPARWWKRIGSFFLPVAFFKEAAGCDRHERESVVGPFWLEDLWAASGIGFKLIAIEFSEGRIFWLLSLMGVFLGKWLSELFFNTSNWRWAA